MFFFWGGESKHHSLPLARAERKPFDRKKKLNPRYQRARPLKETLALLQERSAPRTSAHTRSKIKEKHLPFCRCFP